MSAYQGGYALGGCILFNARLGRIYATELLGWVFNLRGGSVDLAQGDVHRAAIEIHWEADAEFWDAEAVLADHDIIGADAPFLQLLCSGIDHAHGGFHLVALAYRVPFKIHPHVLPLGGGGFWRDGDVQLAGAIERACDAPLRAVLPAAQGAADRSVWVRGQAEIEFDFAVVGFLDPVALPLAGGGG